MENLNLSPLAAASHDLVYRLAQGADPMVVEAGCRELLTKNTNGFGTKDTNVIEVASEIMRGVLSAAVMLRSPAIAAAARGVSDTGDEGEVGDVERRSISERACRHIRDSHDASHSDFKSALNGAAHAAKMTPTELGALVDQTPRVPKHPK